MSVIDRLAEIGLKLPTPPKPLFSYIPFRISGNQLYIAGQTCIVDEVPICTGTVGDDVTIEMGARAAQVCALNTLAVVGMACEGRFERVRALKLTGFIRCTADFDKQPLVLNGASDLLVVALGERGKHTRAALGTNSLPRHSPVEIETIFEIFP